jgi:anaerobic selenocysteine-containing dehydrogenase
MLWARIVDQRRRAESYRIVNLTTFHNRSSELADVEIVFKPNTDIAIWNYVAREIVARGAVDKAFVDKHCAFATGPTDIGFGMRRPTSSLAAERTPRRASKKSSCRGRRRCWRGSIRTSRTASNRPRPAIPASSG